MGEVCTAGVCETGCFGGTIDCGGLCVDPDTDRDFCGATGDCAGANMGIACAAGEVCNGAGVCEVNCQVGKLNCGGACIDPDTDDGFCGAIGDCMASNAGVVCLAGESCDGAGMCALSCQAGLLDCDGTCVDPNTNPDFCGATGDCLASNAGEVCAATAACDGAGVCRPLDLDVMVNGSFETTDYSGWTLGPVGTFANLEGGRALNDTELYFDFVSSNAVTTVCAAFSSTDIPVALTSDGNRVAYHGMSVVGDHGLWQDIQVPAAATTLSWEIAYFSAFSGFTDDTHFYAVNIRDVTSGNLLSTVYKTVPGVDPLVLAAMTNKTADISDYQGQTIRVEFQIMSNAGCFTTLLDNFRTF